MSKTFLKDVFPIVTMVTMDDKHDMVFENGWGNFF